MLSMGAMKGGIYQLLLQSKLSITAVMMMVLKGKGQSELQWYVLVAATLAISAFVMVDSGSDDGGAGIPMMGCLMVLFKVIVSCYAAVLSVLIAANMEPQTQPSYMIGSADPFFFGWDKATWAVTLSFTAKSLITLYLLKLLDSIQKNVGEAMAVIVIFLGQIAGGNSVFDLCAFLLALLVVLIVRIYGLADPKSLSAVKPAGAATYVANAAKYVANKV